MSETGEVASGLAEKTVENEFVVTIDSKQSDDRLLTVTVDKNKTVERKTVIRFIGEHGDKDMHEFFAKRGIELRYTSLEKTYFDGEHEIYTDTKRALERHGIPVEVREISVIRFRWGAIDEIRGKFDVPDARFDFWTYSFECITLNKTEKEHMEIVKRLYQPMKRDGYEISHECSTEIVNGNC